MSVKIRLKRMGKRNTPFYRLVVVDSRWRRDGKTIANIGWYDPVKQPAQMSFKEVEIYKWLEKGVELSDTARNLLKKQGFIQKFRSGAYKEILENSDKPAVVEAAPVEAVAEPVVEEAPVPEAPAPEVAVEEKPAETDSE